MTPATAYSIYGVEREYIIPDPFGGTPMMRARIVGLGGPSVARVRIMDTRYESGPGVIVDGHVLHSLPAGFVNHADISLPHAPHFRTPEQVLEEATGKRGWRLI